MTFSGIDMLARHRALWPDDWSKAERFPITRWERLILVVSRLFGRRMRCPENYRWGGDLRPWRTDSVQPLCLTIGLGGINLWDDLNSPSDGIFLVITERWQDRAGWVHLRVAVQEHGPFGESAMSVFRKTPTILLVAFGDGKGGRGPITAFRSTP